MKKREGALRALILPYVVEAAGRKEAFTMDMEVTSILCIAESRREKGGGLIFKRETEKIRFVLKGFYPIWAVPWGRRSFLFDGLGISQCVLSYEVNPDTEVFAEEIVGSSADRRLYGNLLTKYVGAFKHFAEVRQRTVPNLISRELLIADLIPYLHRAKPLIKEDVGEALLLEPRVAKKDFEETMAQISDFRNTLVKDVEDLRRAVETVQGETEKHIKRIGEEISEIMDEYNERISKLRVEVERDVRALGRKLEHEVTEIMKHAADSKEPLLSQIRDYNKEIERYRRDVEACKQKIERFRQKGDDYSRSVWEKELHAVETAMDEAHEKIERTQAEIRGIEEKMNQEIARTRTRYDQLIDAEWRKVRHLEAERDSRVNTLKAELNALEGKTRDIAESIHKLIDKKRDALKYLEKLTVTTPYKEPTVLYVPFYVTCYESKKKTRWEVQPPASAKPPGGLVKAILGALGKLTVPIEPMSESFNEMFRIFAEALDADKSLANEIYREGIRRNLLRPDIKDTLSKGLVKLEEEGWISEKKVKELQEIFESHLT